MPDRRDLKLALSSRIPLIIVETDDERRFLEVLTGLTVSQDAQSYRPLFRWSVTDGLQRLDLELEPQRHNSDPQEVLGHIRAITKPGIYLLLDFHPYLQDPVTVRLLKDIAIDAGSRGVVIVMVSHAIELPPELQPFSTRFEIALPKEAERKEIVTQVLKSYSDSRSGQPPRIDRKAMSILIKNLSGLGRSEIERLARNAIFDDGAVDESDVPEVMRAKYELLNAGGALSYEYDTSQFGDIAGFRALKTWLAERRHAMSASAPAGLDPPRGVLLLGVQGCGKSAAAKATAGAMGVPLLRLDFGSVYNKFHGETEKNLRAALEQVELMSPCVLWIDEIEKGLSVQSDGDSGTSGRVLGTLLTWLAEHRSGAFIVATANDINALPPELIRKGRFDEVFFVDLPDIASRSEVFAIHLRKRGLKPDQFDLEALAAASEGYSGAEIEQAIVAGLYAAHARQESLNAGHLLEEIGKSRPLSVIMREQINTLRHWARSRTRPAD